jgi:hypothetical protein
MENIHAIDVTQLDTLHRHAFEDVIGAKLQGNQRLLISVTEVGEICAATTKSVQSLRDWTGIYSGLNEDQIETIDQDVKTRADLTRNP